MAQIAASGVTAALVEGTRISCPGDPRFSAVFTLTFGDGTATYTSGGIPLTRAKLGCPASLQELHIMNPSSNDAIVYKYNHTAESIQLYPSLHNFVMAGGVTTTADFLYHSSGAIGKAAATNITLAGTGVIATTGGVLAGAEMSTAATVSATSLRVRVVGW